MSNPVRVSVIGPGALGSAMIDLVSGHYGFKIQTVWGRSPSDCYRVDDNGRKLPVGYGFPKKIQISGASSLSLYPTIRFRK